MARMASTAAAMAGSAERQPHGGAGEANRASARSRRWFASNFMRPSAQAPREMRADRVRHRHRQALPQRDEGAVFRVERIVLRDARAAVEAVLVGERRGLEAPVALEVEGAGALLA